MTSLFQLAVKDASNKLLTVNVTPDSTVGEVKDLIRQKSGTASIDLIFCGKVLDENARLRDVDVHGSSTLFYSIKSPARPQPTTDWPSRNDQQSMIRTDPGMCHYFVYCKDVCEDFTPAKLRVCCAECHCGNFVLDRDPQEWEDVLQRGRLTGVCQMEGCNGKIAEFFFKCASHGATDEEKMTPLPMLKRNFQEKECPLCLTSSDVMVVFDCPDNHCICVDCFKEYCKTALQNRSFIKNDKVGYTMPCPVQGHDQFVVSEPHHFHVLGKKDYDKYQNLATEMYLIEMGGVFCPKSKCGEGLLPEERRVRCRCGYTFCRDCKNDYHPGKCSQASSSGGAREGRGAPNQVRSATQFQDARWQRTQDWIRQHSKPCPRCNAPTEKNDGCMHMTCAACKYEYCWMCREPWGRKCMSDHWFG